VAAAKGIAGWLGGSLSMLADAAHSAFDSSSNIVGLVAITVAARGPDREHPYGHQRFEVLGAATIGVFLALVVAGIVEGAVERIRNPATSVVTPLQLGALLLTLAVNIAVSRYERRKGEELRSAVLLADAQHTGSDIYATLAVVAALAATWLGWPQVDPFIALAIAAYVGWVALRVLLRASDVLADRAALEAEAVARVATAVTGVVDVHDVRTRGPEGAVFADLRVHVDPAMSVRDAHDVAHAVEAALRREFPAVVDIVVHVEPAGECHA
jgi:cation diffusion facilitator family transporter